MFSRIKAFLRGNSFYVNHLQRRVNDCRYFASNIKFYICHFSFRKDKEVEGNTLYFVYDPSQKHPGLADRLKVICCVYYIAKINGFDFKLIFETPFKLCDYLECNKYNWVGHWEDLSFSFKNSRMLAYNGMGKIPHLNKKYKQYLIYYYIGKNILQCNHVPEWEKVWAECYNDLFKPSYKLLNAYKISGQGYKERSYIAVHLRFVNALEHFEDGHYNSLNKEKQDKLIERCLNALTDIQIKENKPIIVFSDSNRFLNIAKMKGYAIIDGEVHHISFQVDKDNILKTFLDFYMIGRSEKTYRILAPEMYATTFSYYAAISGGSKFETLSI